MAKSSQPYLSKRGEVSSIQIAVLGNSLMFALLLDCRAVMRMR